MQLKENASVGKSDAKKLKETFDKYETFEKENNITGQVKDVSGLYSVVPLADGTVSLKIMNVSKIETNSSDVKRLESYFMGWVILPNQKIYSADSLKVFEAETANGIEYFVLPNNIEYKGQPLTPLDSCVGRHIMDTDNRRDHIEDWVCDNIKWNGFTFQPGQGLRYGVKKKGGGVVCLDSGKIHKVKVKIDGDICFVYYITDMDEQFTLPQLSEIMGLAGFGDSDLKETVEYTFDFPEDTDNLLFKYLKMCLHGRTVSVPQENLSNLKNFSTQIENETITLNLLKKLTNITGIKFSVVATDEICPRITIKIPKLPDEKRKKLDVSNEEYQALRSKGIEVPDCDEALMSLNEDSSLADLQRLVSYYRESLKQIKLKEEL